MSISDPTPNSSSLVTPTPDKVLFDFKINNETSGNFKWPSQEMLEGAPLFNKPLTLEDLDALQEAAGLGPSSWWLDPVYATNGIEACGNLPALLNEPSYEEEIALTAWSRTPFECAGEIRDASRGLLDRLDELSRLKALADDSALQNLNNKTNNSLYHSTLSLASSNVFDHESLNDLNKLPPKSFQRKNTFVVKNEHSKLVKFTPPNQGAYLNGPITSSPMNDRKSRLNEPIANEPRYSKSPGRHKNAKESNKLMLTFSKEGFNEIDSNQSAYLQRNANCSENPVNVSYDLDNPLRQTFNNDELSDAFSSAPGSNENLQSNNLQGKTFNMVTPKLNQSTFLPTMKLRNYTYNQANNSFSSARTYNVSQTMNEQENSLQESGPRTDLRPFNKNHSTNSSLEAKNSRKLHRLDTYVQNSNIPPNCDENRTDLTVIKKGRFFPNDSTESIAESITNHLEPPISCKKLSDTNFSLISTNKLLSLQLQSEENALRSSLPTTLSETEIASGVKSLKPSSSQGSNNTSFQNIIEIAKQEEASLRESLKNNKLANSLAHSDSSRENCSKLEPNQVSLQGNFQQSNVSLTGTGSYIGYSRNINRQVDSSGLRNLPPIHRKRTARISSSHSTNDLLTKKELSTSQLSLRNITSVSDLCRQQEEDLRKSSESVFRTTLSGNALNKSSDCIIIREDGSTNSVSIVKDSSAIKNEIEFPLQPAESESDPLISKTPAYHTSTNLPHKSLQSNKDMLTTHSSSQDKIFNPLDLAKQQYDSLRASEDKYSSSSHQKLSSTMNKSEEIYSTERKNSVNSKTLNEPIPTVQSSGSPVHMRKLRQTSSALKISQDVNQNLSVNNLQSKSEGIADDKDALTVTVRPDSYAEHLHNPDLAAHAVDAWVTDTLVASETPVNQNSSYDCTITSLDVDTRCSADTHAILSPITSHKIHETNKLNVDSLPQNTTKYELLPSQLIPPVSKTVSRTVFQSRLRPPSSNSSHSRPRLVKVPDTILNPNINKAGKSSQFLPTQKPHAQSKPQIVAVKNQSEKGPASSSRFVTPTSRDRLRTSTLNKEAIKPLSSLPSTYRSTFVEPKTSSSVTLRSTAPSKPLATSNSVRSASGRSNFLPNVKAPPSLRTSTPGLLRGTTSGVSRGGASNVTHGENSAPRSSTLNIRRGVSSALPRGSLSNNRGLNPK